MTVWLQTNILSGARSADGSCNNLREPRYGMADTSLNRIVEPEYGNGVDTPRRSR